MDRTGLGRLHGVSRRIRHKDKALWRKFWECPNCPKCPYGKGIFLGKFIEFVRFEGNGGQGGFRSRRIQTQGQN